MSIPTASHAEIRRAAEEIARALRTTYFDIDSIDSKDRLVRLVSQNGVTTNIGRWAFYGYRKARVIVTGGAAQVASESDLVSRHLIAVSEIPTSQQKVILLEAIAVQVAKLLGAGEGALVDRDDPTKSQTVDAEAAGRVAAQAGEKLDSLRETDAYKTITEPYTISTYWPMKTVGG